MLRSNDCYDTKLCFQLLSVQDREEGGVRGGGGRGRRHDDDQQEKNGGNGSDCA